MYRIEDNEPFLLIQLFGLARRYYLFTNNLLYIFEKLLWPGTAAGAAFCDDWKALFPIATFHFEKGKQIRLSIFLSCLPEVLNKNFES